MPWTKIVEAHGVRIRLFERAGTIYRDVTLGRTVSSSGRARTKHDVKSLGHSDRRLAEQQAKALAAYIAEARLTGADFSQLTLAQLFNAYRQHRLPHQNATRVREAETKFSMFLDAWGGSLKVADIDATRVAAYCKLRRSLEVVPPAMKLGPGGERRRGYRTPTPPRDGALDNDFRWLSSVLNWACGFRVGGKRLLSENPLRGVEWPREKNPRRPVASHERFLRTMEHVDTVDPAGRLRCILALARYTGRREDAICKLMAKDLLLSADRIREALAAAGLDEGAAAYMPHGAIRWRSETDKKGFLHVSPISEAARQEIDRYLRLTPRVGEAPLFPAPRAPEKPLRRETAMKWLMRAEELAKLPKLRGGTFHPYRRLWGTERKSLPDIDVAQAGGWRSTQALKLSYQHADPETVLRVVEGA